VSTTENRAAANLAAVGGIYEAFGRGDSDFILGQIADDCEWESWLDNHGQNAGIPPMKPRRGPAGVAEFFKYVGTMQIQDFQVLDMLASERQVVVEVQISIALPDGGSVTDEELHLYSLKDDGKINRMRHYVDTAKQIKAYGLGK
jgi:ketosteroid isomerase-like protein